MLLRRRFPTVRVRQAGDPGSDTGGSNMRAAAGMSRPDGRFAGSVLTDTQRETIRGLLLAGLDEQTAQIESQDGTVEPRGASDDADSTTTDREMAVAQVERARSTIAEISAAVRRLDEGRFGTCESCSRVIPFERLEAIPQARFCVACALPSGFVR